MASQHVTIYTGTTVSRQEALRFMMKVLRRTGRPGRFLRALMGNALMAEFGYSRLKRGCEEVGLEVDLITLHKAGTCDPDLRHQRAAGVVARKRSKHGIERRIVMGHSQGALEALEDGLACPEEVDAIILLDGPLDGAHGAQYARFTFGRSMAHGSEYLQQLYERQAELITRKRETPGLHLPEIHVIACQHSGIISVDSSLAVHPDYPRAKKYVLSYGNPHRTGAQWVPTEFWGDNHLGMIWDPNLIRLVRNLVVGGLGRQVVQDPTRASLQLVPA